MSGCVIWTTDGKYLSLPNADIDGLYDMWSNCLTTGRMVLLYDGDGRLLACLNPGHITRIVRDAEGRFGS